MQSFVIVPGVVVEIEFIEPSPEASDSVNRFILAYTPNQNRIVRARRKFANAFYKLVKLGMPTDMIASALDYIGTSDHLNYIDEYVDMRNVKNANLTILSQSEQFIQDGKFIGKNAVDRIKEKIRKFVLGDTRMRL